ncbi:MAG: cyclic pyranopterin monophosphate synthase MoaC [Clostridiales bacterium]|nr:cyclic pyranopterin monophosphate synthase MoaC [Clostridiales bacterium]
MNPEFTHFDKQGNAVMVDVSEKPVTSRTATAQGSILVCAEIMQAVQERTVKKGDVLGVARVAGIMGVKQTAALIPLCHTLLIQKCSIDFDLHPEQGRITAICTVQCSGQTGVEMEALTGVSTALLTIYDMCKAIDRTMTLTDIRLVEKKGGQSGHFVHPDSSSQN